MNNTNENKLVPKLRFPEFRNSDEWEEKNLGEACEMQAGKFVSASEIIDQKADGLFPCYGGNGLRGYTKSFTHTGKYSLIGRQGALCGNITLADGKFHATEHAVVVTPKNKIDTLWLFYELEILNLNQYATGQAQPGLSVTNLEKIELCIPSDVKEQRKIANCLSSLDDLITAESQKLALLKEHKKGLLQNLFPQEGETVPKLRFPEFVKGMEWEEKDLGALAENLDSKRIPITSNQREKGNIPYYGASGIIDYVKEYIYNENLLCISEDGANLIDRNYPIAFSISGKTWVNNHTHVLKFENINTQLLVEKYINSINIEDFLTGMAQPKLNRGKLDIIPIPLPKNPKEQKKIASCLTSIDDLINAQNQKVEALKLHKKGLLQGLFPEVNVVNE